MRHGSHLLRVRVQDRRRNALISPEPHNRRERQADSPDDQRKPDWDPILCHVSVLQSAKPRSTARRDMEGSLRGDPFVFTVG